MTRVGIVGGGQLGRMLALAGHDLGIECTTLDPAPGSPAAASRRRSSARTTIRSGSPSSLGRRRRDLRVRERALSKRRGSRSGSGPVFPPPGGARGGPGSPRGEARCSAASAWRCPPCAAVDDARGDRRRAGRLGVPGRPQDPTLGYDGKGQAVIRDPLLGGGRMAVGGRGTVRRSSRWWRSTASSRSWPCAVVTGRPSPTRSSRTTTETASSGSRAPAPDLSARAAGGGRGHAAAVMDELGYVGVLAVELFQVGEQPARRTRWPRGCTTPATGRSRGPTTSQFENHLRAVTGLPLGPTDPLGVARW